MVLRTFTVVAVLSALLAFAGCVPDRVVWSPDGTRAAIIGSDGLHLCDASGGNLSPLLVPDCSTVAWMPDGKKVVIIRRLHLTTWKEFHEALPDFAVKDRDSVRKELLAYAGDPAKVVPSIAETLHKEQDQIMPALLQLRDTEAATLQPQLGDRWKELSDLSCELGIGQVMNLANGKATPEKPLISSTHSLGELVGLRVSPTGKTVVFAIAPEHNEGGDKQQAVTLVAEATDGSTQEDVYLGKTAWFSDWSPDGRYLVYIKPLGDITGKDEAHLGMLVRREIVNEQGKLWTTNTLPEEEELVGLLYQGQSRVRVLKDGRIFFVAMEVNLPTTLVDIDTAPTLYSFQPGKQATVTRVIPRSATGVGDLIQFFEISPDMTRVSIPSEDGQVSILDLATGKVVTAQGIPTKSGGNGWKLSSVPTWRSATELTFVKPAGEDQHEVVLYSVTDQSEKILSATWPQEVRDQWLTQKQAATKP